MSQPCSQPELPPPAVPGEVKELPAQPEPQAPQPEVSQPEPLQELPARIPTCIPGHCMYKNRLQEYAQKSSISLPIYKTVNEAPAHHLPMFRSTVFVDDVYYTSSLTFSSRKAAEQDVAKIALDSISNKIKQEGCPIIYEDTIFCKSVLNEYAVKMNLPKATYATTQAEGVIPIFVSSLLFNGLAYTGPVGRNKKEAEQLAARTVIQSILDRSDSRTVMSEIVKSKTKLYDALHKGKDQHGAQSGFFVSAAAANSGVPPAEVPGHAIIVPSAAIPVPGLGIQPSYPATHEPSHEFRKRKPESSLEDEITLPIAFVPPVMEQPLGSCSTSGRKKNKKKAKKKAKKEVAVVDNQVAVLAVPLCQLPPCSVAQ